MIDFATLQGLTIPEGVVTQITDASGRVIWKAAPSEATITLTFLQNTDAPQPYVTKVTINGVSYPSMIQGNPDMTTKEVVVPLGTVITCKTMHGDAGVGKITLNGETVVDGAGEYEYTVVGNATIHSTGTMTSSTARHGIINITET